MKTDRKEKPRSRNVNTEAMQKLIIEKSLNNDENFFNFFKLTPKQFEHLHSLFETRIKYRNSVQLPSSTFKVSSKDRLAITLRYLAGGDFYKELSTPLQIEKPAVPSLIIETCEVITDVLQPLVMAKPTTEKWLEIAKNFSKIWDLPHCLGAIDIRHIQMQVSTAMGWTQYNRKGLCALSLLAVVDSQYNFILIDVGAPGHLYDKEILRQSNLGYQLQHRRLSLPPPEVIPETNIIMPYNFIGDEGFPLKENLMRPYQGSDLSEGQKTFNYKISQARQCIENAFAIMSSHFRIFQSPIPAKVEMTVAAVEAATCLHNYIILSESSVHPSKRLYGASKIINSHKLIKGEGNAIACDDQMQVS